MSTTIQERLMEACILIINPDGDFGSGYVIACGVAATAAHVVEYWPDQVEFPVLVGWGPRRSEAMAKVVRRNELTDAAVLELTGCDDVKPVPIGGPPLDKSLWDGFGFPKVASLNANPTGVPLTGRVLNARWFHPNGNPQLLLLCDQTMTRAAMHGASGSAITVGGALVGHIVEQFTDPNDRTQAVLGEIKACPIKEVLALLPSGARLRKLQPPAPASDISIAELFSWCDREAIAYGIKDWLERTSAGGAGLLCLVGHSENRPMLLLDRVAKELSEQKPNKVPTSAVHILKDVDPDNALHFRRTALGYMDVDRDEQVRASAKFNGVGGLVLLCQTCSFSGKSAKEVEKRILQASRWLEGLVLGRRRLVLVLTVSFDDVALKASAESKMKSALAVARKAHEPLSRLLLDSPIVLSDYDANHFRRWIALPIVKSSLGSSTAAIEDGVLAAWQANAKLSHGTLLQMIKESQQPDY